MGSRVLLIGVVMLLFAGGAWSQDGKKAFKVAQKSLNQYNLDTQDFSKLAEAKEAIDVTLQDKDLQSESKAWQLMGDIYNEIVTQYVVSYRTSLGTIDSALVEGNPALTASQAYRKALDYAKKKYEVRDALRGLFAMQGNLSNFGLFRYEDGQFLTAHNCFREILAVHEILKANGEESMMDDEEVLNNQIFITGLAALNADRPAIARPYFEQLYEKYYDKPAVYEALYQIVSGMENPEAAYPILEAGRRRYPNNVSLLFADINHYLKVDKMEELIGKLEEAIRAEPQNVSLFFTLGSVYDNLYQKVSESSDTLLVQRYFEQALNYYHQALGINADYFDAIYSIGVLYYNRAALITVEMNALSDDYSQEALQQYDALKEKVFEQFDRALPYFKRCETLDPDHINTLVALAEIFDKKNNITLAEEFRRRLEQVQNGEKIESSFFQK